MTIKYSWLFTTIHLTVTLATSSIPSRISDAEKHSRKPI